MASKGPLHTAETAREQLLAKGWPDRGWHARAHGRRGWATGVDGETARRRAAACAACVNGWRDDPRARDDLRREVALFGDERDRGRCTVAGRCLAPKGGREGGRDDVQNGRPCLCVVLEVARGGPATITIAGEPAPVHAAGKALRGDAVCPLGLWGEEEVEEGAE